MRYRGLAAGVALAMMVAACSASADDPDPAAPGLTDITDEATSDPGADSVAGERTDAGAGTEPPAPEPLPTEPDDDPEDDRPSDDPFAVPDPIDESYVELVINELLARASDHDRELLRRPLRTPLVEDDVRILEALHGGPELRYRTTVSQDLLNSPERRELAQPADEYGVALFDVMEIHDTSETCVTAFGWLDTSETTRTPYDDETHGVYVLVRDEGPASDLNPTGWQFWDNTILTTPEGENIPQEAWAGLDFTGVIDIACGEGA